MSFLRSALAARLLLAVAMLLPAASASALDANRATAAQLTTIKGLGPATAERIVRERERAGAYLSPQDLSERVRGIGMRRLQGLLEAGLTVDKPAAASSPPAKAPAATRRP